MISSCKILLTSLTQEILHIAVTFNNWCAQGSCVAAPTSNIQISSCKIELYYQSKALEVEYGSRFDLWRFVVPHVLSTKCLIWHSPQAANFIQFTHHYQQGLSLLQNAHSMQQALGQCYHTYSRHWCSHLLHEISSGSGTRIRFGIIGSIWIMIGMDDHQFIPCSHTMVEKDLYNLCRAALCSYWKRCPAVLVFGINICSSFQ